MSFIADLHIHSCYSRATSKECNLEGLHRWAQLKGVQVVGTGDCTHPAWFRELQEKLTPAAPGLYRLTNALADTIDQQVPGICRQPVHFMITGEISSIYKRDGQVRKVHSIIILPDLDTAAKVNRVLEQLGNIASDGRPILGLDPRRLLEIILDAHPDSYLIPAHIWTPWFSMLGSKSGFDSVTECFGDLANHIFAVETGLSSDPPMNWRISALDRLTLVSNSDLHSPANMARNANIFGCNLDYFAMRDALRNKDPQACGGTIDMFPEEGKYHLDGHRKCGVRLEPAASLAHQNLCPACGKPLTLGVLHRVAALADRPPGVRPEGALPHQYTIGLVEILAELLACGAGSKKVQGVYHQLLEHYGSELYILRECPPEHLRQHGPELLPEALRRLRAGQVLRSSGYDGEYGQIHLFEPDEMLRIKHHFMLTRATNLQGRLKAEG